MNANRTACVPTSRYLNGWALISPDHLRSFFAFDPRRAAILLIGGDKTGDKGFYDRMIPVADRLFDEYLAELRKEGRIR